MQIGAKVVLIEPDPVPMGFKLQLTLLGRASEIPRPGIIYTVDSAEYRELDERGYTQAFMITLAELKTVSCPCCGKFHQNPYHAAIFREIEVVEEVVETEEEVAEPELV